MAFLLPSGLKLSLNLKVHFVAVEYICFDELAEDKKQKTGPPRYRLLQCIDYCSLFCLALFCLWTACGLTKHFGDNHRGDMEAAIAGL